MKPNLFVLPVALLLTLSLCSSAQAALSLVVNTFNATTLSVTVSGTLDAATSAPTLPGVFTIAADELVSTAFYTTSPTALVSNISIGGNQASVFMVVNGGTTGYSFYFFTSPGTSTAAGTAISGTATITNTFTSQPALSIWSGYDGDRNLRRLEAAGVIPEPSTALLGALGSLALLRRRR